MSEPFCAARQDRDLANQFRIVEKANEKGLPIAGTGCLGGDFKGLVDQVAINGLVLKPTHRTTLPGQIVQRVEAGDMKALTRSSIGDGHVCCICFRLVMSLEGLPQGLDLWV